MLNKFKRIISIIGIISMLISYATVPAFAAGTVTIKVEKAVPGYPVSVFVDGEAVTTQTVTYYVAEDKDGTYEPIDGATGNEWQITNACANKYIKADVDGEKSDAIEVGAGLTGEGTSIVSNVATGKQTQYAFRLSGSTENANAYYEVLDSETVDGEKQYLILRAGQSTANGNVGKSGTVKWMPDADPSTNKTMAYWLEHYWYEGVDTPDAWKGTPTSGQPPINGINNATLDSSIKPYVVEHTWLTANNNNTVTNDYTFKAHATVMSSTEFRKYASKLKVDANVMLRNGRKDVDEAFQYYNYKTAYFNKIGPTSRQYYVFPIFYVTEDFFKNVKLDWEATGADVKALIKEHNGSNYDKLKTIGYSNAEIASLGIEVPIEVIISAEKAVPGYKTAVTIDGEAITDESVTYYISDSEDGTYELIGGAAGDNWQITNACAGKYIKADILGTKSNALLIGEGATVYTTEEAPAGAPMTNPQRYTIKLAAPEDSAVSYQMLDTQTVSGKKQYLLLQTGKSAASGKLTKESDFKWNPEEVLTVSYWLDKIWKTDDMQGSTYLKENGGIFSEMLKMDSSLRSYLADDKTWLTERDGVNILNDYTFNAGVSILSRSEYEKYYTKIGQSSLTNSWFRTPKGSAENWYFSDELNTDAAEYKILGAAPNTTDSYNVYPIFYVTEDFFKNVKLDVTATGSDAKALIVEHNNSNIEALKAIGYTENEIVALGIDVPAQIVISAKKAVPGYEVLVTTDGEAVTTQSITYWVSATEGGTYTQVENASGNNWQITNACENMYLKADINGMKSNAIKIGAGVSLNTAWQPLTKPQTPKPSQYSFKVEGASNASTYYQLLETENVDGRYEHFVIQQGATVVNGKISNNSSNKKWDPTLDPTTEKHMAYWMDNYFLAQVSSPSSWTQSSGGPINNNNGANQIETKLKDYVIKDHIWLTERNNTVVTDDYTFKAGVTILSRAEFDKHADKLHQTSSDNMRFALRSGQPTSDKAYVYYGATSYSAISATASYYNFWPVFYLDEDFFKNVKLNLEETGSEVKSMIVSTIPKAEMLAGKAGYTEEELVSIGYPQDIAFLEDAVIAGNLAVGQRVSARYIFNDNGLGREDGGSTLYQWYRGASSEGTFTPISGANTFDYTITDDDLGKYLQVEIVAYDDGGNILDPAIVTANTPVSGKMVLTAVFNKLTDGSDTTIERVSGVTEAKAVYTITNTGSADSVALLIILYDSENTMLKAGVSESVSIATGTNDYSVSVAGLDSAKSYICKAMVLDSLGNMRPISIDERK